MTQTRRVDSRQTSFQFHALFPIRGGQTHLHLTLPRLVQQCVSLQDWHLISTVCTTIGEDKYLASCILICLSNHSSLHTL